MHTPPNLFQQAIAQPGAQIGLWLGLADSYTAEPCATSDPSGQPLLLWLARLNRVRAVDPLHHTPEAEAGATLQRVQVAAQESGCLFPLTTLPWGGRKPPSARNMSSRRCSAA